MIRFGCPGCKMTLTVADHQANTKVNCSGCGQRLLVPPASAPPQINLNQTVVGVKLSQLAPPALATAARAKPGPAAHAGKASAVKRQSSGGYAIFGMLAAGLLITGIACAGGLGVGVWWWTHPRSPEADDQARSNTPAAPIAKKNNVEPLAIAQPNPAKNDTAAKLTGQQVYERVLKSTVWINNPGVGSGTGVLVDAKEKLVLTNFHVICQLNQSAVAPYVSVNFPVFQGGQVIADRSHYWNLYSNDREKYKGKVVAWSLAKDLALVKVAYVPPGVQAVPLAKEGGHGGQGVHSIGNPGGSGALWAYTSGTVRSAGPFKKQWQSRGPGGFMNHDAVIIEAQSPTNPGDSGGPLVNDAAELVAVTQGINQGVNSINLFIDVTEVRAILASYANKEQTVPDKEVAKTPPDLTPPPGGEYRVKLFVPAKVGQVRQLSGTFSKAETTKKPGEAVGVSKTFKVTFKGRLTPLVVNPDGKVGRGELAIEQWSAQNHLGPVINPKSGDLVAFELVGSARNFRLPAGQTLAPDVLTSINSLVGATLQEPGVDEAMLHTSEISKAVGASWGLDKAVFLQKLNSGGVYPNRPDAVKGKFTLAGLEKHRGSHFLDIKLDAQIDLNDADVKSPKGDQPAVRVQGLMGMKMTWRMPADYATGVVMHTHTFDVDLQAAGSSFHATQTVEMFVNYAAIQGGEVVLDRKDQLTDKDPGYKPKTTNLGPNLMQNPVVPQLLQLIQGNPHKVYTLQFKKGDRVTIEMKSAIPQAIDPVVIVEDANKNILDLNDDNPEAKTLDSKLVWTAPADGQYRIIATTMQQIIMARTGEFQLTVTKAK